MPVIRPPHILLKEQSQAKHIINPQSSSTASHSQYAQSNSQAPTLRIRLIRNLSAEQLTALCWRDCLSGKQESSIRRCASNLWILHRAAHCALWLWRDWILQHLPQRYHLRVNSYRSSTTVSMRYALAARLLCMHTTQASTARAGLQVAVKPLQNNSMSKLVSAVQRSPHKSILASAIELLCLQLLCVHNTAYSSWLCGYAF